MDAGRSFGPPCSCFLKVLGMSNMMKTPHGWDMNWYDATPLSREDLQQFLAPYSVHAYDNEKVIGKLNFNISNSYGGVDFKISAYVPIDDELRDLYLRWLNAKWTEATQLGDPKIVNYYIEKYRTFMKTTYIEDLLEITDLAISSRRSVPPVRRLGEVSPVAHAKGVRTLAGTMIMALLKKDPLVELYGPDAGDQQDNSPFFIDRVPPFHLILTATNEYGHTISAGIFHVTIVDFGTTLSVNDMFTEFQYSFKALYMTPFVHQDVRENLRRWVDMVGKQSGEKVGDIKNVLQVIKNKYENLPPGMDLDNLGPAVR